MKFSFVIPTINQTDMLFNCINSIFKCEKDRSKYNVYVVEDGSSPETKETIDTFCKQNNVNIIHNHTNLGFSKTVNKGIQAADGDIVILLNNDTLLGADVLEHFKKSFNLDPKIAVVGGLIFYPNRLVQHAGVYFNGKYFTHYGHGQPFNQVDKQYLKPRYAVGVTGALFAIRKSLVADIGLFNEDFFLAYEDVEYCMRVWDKGYKIYYNPEIQIIHREGGTRGRTIEEKLEKAPYWYFKEQETLKLFNKLVTLPLIDKVNKLVEQENKRTQ